MLARVLFMIVVSLCSVASAERSRPDIILVELRDSSSLDTQGWQQQKGSCLVSPGRSAVQTALLFGTSPMQQGVVSDLNWRRQPIQGETLAHRLSKQGYQTHFYGAWALGSTPPYDPSSRGFEHVQYFEAGERDTLTDWFNTTNRIPRSLLGPAKSAQPTFKHIAEGRHLSRKHILDQLQAWMAEVKRSAIVVILETNNPVQSSLQQSSEEKPYHHPGKWRILRKGKIKGKLKGDLEIASDRDIHRSISSDANISNDAHINIKPAFEVFHQANWSLTEPHGKYRHRGSLVLGGGYALIDGLRLYRAEKWKPDLSTELSLTKFAKEHQALLTAHAKWWQPAGIALRDPRAFEVGKKDGEKTRLTALDWRPSKIIGPAGNSPTSPPMIYQKDLIAIIKGLKNDPQYNANFPAYSGSWAVRIARPGRYEITASLLPRDSQDQEHQTLMKLNGGSAHIRLGSNVAQLALTKGASAISLQTDADPGTLALECWFTGQLALTRELGAFCVEIERIGEKKFDLKAKGEKLGQ